MGKHIHRISNVNESTRTATCAGCGDGVPVAFKAHKGRWVCRVGDGRRRPVPPSLRRRRHLAYKYGITPDEYEALHESQGGVCAICEQPCEVTRRLAVDHDHDTGRIRGLLCNRCNRAIGLMNDRPERLLRAVTYLTN